MSELLTTFAPPVTDTDRLFPTGNLTISLPELTENGDCLSLNVVSAAQRGLVEAVGSPTAPLLAPRLTVNSSRVSISGLEWERELSWLPVGRTATPEHSLVVRYLVPIEENGVAARLEYTNQSESDQWVELEWRSEWHETYVRHFRAKKLTAQISEREDTWTGCRTLYAGTETLILALSWRPGNGAVLLPDPVAGVAGVIRAARVLPGETLILDCYLGVAIEPDGSSGTALHLRRTGFDTLHSRTTSWLAARSLKTDFPELNARLNLNLFFNYFFSQADCIDNEQAVMLTSRSPRYYVCGAFWSRDAYSWSFPAILLADAHRARRVLIQSIATAANNIAHHALYITGTRLYPGFELDELTAPMIAIARYIAMTGDRTVGDEPAILAFRRHFLSELEQWHGPAGLYGTFLLPTDDPTDYPFVATANATVVAALRVAADLEDDEPTQVTLHLQADELAELIPQLLVHDGRWAWAINDSGEPEWRDEPPLSLRTLAYWGATEPTDRAFTATTRWLTTEYDYHYPGRYPGAGAPHFAAPSSFDLANRMLTANDSLGDPLRQFVETPLDNGVGCESWDPETGRVHSGAAMASVAGFLAWTAWAAHTGHNRWDQPLLRTDNGFAQP